MCLLCNDSNKCTVSIILVSVGHKIAAEGWTIFEEALEEAGPGQPPTGSTNNMNRNCNCAGKCNGKWHNINANYDPNQ